MAQKQQQRKSGGMRKYGRNLDKCKVYKSHQTREKHKLKRIARYDTIAAVQYARKHGLSVYMTHLLATVSPRHLKGAQHDD